MTEKEGPPKPSAAQAQLLKVEDADAVAIIEKSNRSTGEEYDETFASPENSNEIDDIPLTIRSSNLP